MPVRTTKAIAVSNHALALELTKAALLGGAVKGLTHSEEMLLNQVPTANRLAVESARLDAAYAVRLYQGILTRLNKADDSAAD